MVEFASKDTAEKVAKAEYRKTMELLEEIDLLSSDIESRTPGKDDVIELADYQLLMGYVDALIGQAPGGSPQNASGVIEALRVKGKPEDPLAPSFIQFIEKRLAKPLEPLREHKVVYDAAKEPVSIDALQIPSYARKYLELELALKFKKDAGTTDFSSNREDFRALKIHPTGFFLPEAKAELAELATLYPGVLDDQPRFQSEAAITKNETDELGSFIIDYLNKTLGEEQARKVIDDRIDWFVDNLDALTNLLRVTQSYEGNKPSDIDIPEGVVDLQKALSAALELKKKLLKQKQITPSLDENAPFKDYNSTEDRFRQLLEILNLVMDIEKTPQFTVWKEQIIKGFIVTPDGKAPVDFDTFLDRSKKTLDAKTKLDDASDVAALHRVLDFLEAQQSIIGLTEYEQNPDAKFNSHLQEAKNKYLSAQIARVKELIAKDNELKGRSESDEVHKESNLVKEELVRLMFNELQKKNPNLPNFREMKDYVERAPNGFASFMQELLIAIGEYIINPVFNATASSGATDVPLPKGEVSLWTNLKFKVTSRDITGEDSLETFFRDFPWADIMPGVSQATIDSEWLDLWKYRFLHIEAMHNYARDLAAMSGKFQSPDNPEEIVGIFGKEKTEGGGYFHWDLPAFYKRKHSGSSTSKAEQELSRVFDKTEGEETYWRVPELVNYFTSGVERELPDLVYLSRSDKKTELSRLREKLIRKIPEGTRLKRPDGTYSDEALIQIGWDMAIWTMMVTLRIFDYDDDGLDSKFAWYVNTGEYATKVTHGKMNTGYEWRDTGVEQVNRIWPTRADFIHFYVDLSPDKYVRYQLEDVIAEKQTLIDKMNSEPNAEKKEDLKRRIAQISKFIIETRQVGVGEYQDLQSLGSLNDIQRRLESMPQPGEAGTTPVDEEEYDRLSSFLAQVKDKLTELRAVRPELTEDQIFDQLRKFAQNVAVNDRYRIIKIKPEFSALRGPNPAEWPDITEMTYIRIPESYIKYSWRKAGSNPRRADFIAMTDRQIMDSMIDPEYVKYGSITPTHARTWAGAASDGKKWMDFLKTRDTKAVFTPIHESPLAKHNIHKRTHLSDFKTDLERTMRSATAYIVTGLNKLGLSEDISSQAEALDRKLREDVVITHMTIDDLAKKQSEGGMGFSEITQSGARYYCEKINTGAGPVYKDGEVIEDAQPVTEMWLNVFRKPYHGVHIREVGHGRKHKKVLVHETIRELRNRITDPKKLRAAKATVVPEGIRLAADIALSVDTKGGSMHQAAQNQFVVESFIIAVGLYLDQYRYKSVEGETEIPFDPGLLETVRHEVETISGAEAMDFAHRELFLQMCDMTFESFLGADFGGDNFDGALNKKIVRSYGRGLVEQMMRDRGLIGTKEQYVVDTHYYKSSWTKVGEVAEKDKKSGH